MKRFICYYRTLKQWKLFLYTLFNFGAIYIAHDYEEVFNGYVKERNRFESVLKCKVCGKESIAWGERQLV